MTAATPIHIDATTRRRTRTRTPKTFRARGRDIVADPIMLAGRRAGDRAAWRFNLTLPGARRKTAITVSGYIDADPTVTLKEVIASLLEPPIEDMPA